MSKTTVDKIICYRTSCDYGRLVEKMQSSSVICIITEPYSGHQKLCRTKYITGDGWDDFSVDTTNGSNVIHSVDAGAFIAACTKLNLEYIS